ncbi:uncharacterized protein TRUGW13939_07499 [Talaromyces rugulosus]|uniref:Major facilitator superfamily (MFS) profile domain-containing protein n=1 Tax=Talaromyces rugulosus TaxID=121627 RepID=A0A7H8R1V7_TALRU|nr:uncharacterized protein TRUGW13939_07499 [Talaromyces rugulosus]QKX60354.1 hypothetical protein TRUGW13939_07499 [Talaromyces rugulosus]
MDENIDHVEKEKAEIRHIDRVYLVQTEAEEEHNASTWKTLKSNPKIIALCLFANIGPLMYGFDNLATSLSWWQSLWNALSQVGTMLGAWSVGFIADRFGRKVCFAIFACVSAAGIAVLYISSTPGVFLGGKIVNAVSLGMAIAVGQIYISEITPLAMRSVALSGFTFSMAFPNISFHAYKYPLIAEGDYVVGRWIGGGKHTGVGFDDLAVGKLDKPNTGREVYFSGTTIFTLKAGKIVDEVGEEQALTALQQLELVHPPNPGKEVKYDVQGNHI